MDRLLSCVGVDLVDVSSAEQRHQDVNNHQLHNHQCAGKDNTKQLAAAAAGRQCCNFQ